MDASGTGMIAVRDGFRKAVKIIGIQRLLETDTETRPLLTRWRGVVGVHWWSGSAKHEISAL
jgi:hypothetical protein